METFRHVSGEGTPTMVDVSGKARTERTALAVADLRVGSAITAAFADGDVATPKGPVIQTAVIAGIQAAKNTASLIPLCHPLPLDRCEVSVTPDLEAGRISVACRVATTWTTGVEMEALTGASVAALTLYDMCKSISHDMEIVSVRLEEKTGGKQGTLRPGEAVS
jgi:cyclic pyranopterin phosphate synthase